MDDLGNRVGSNTIRTGATSSSVSYVLDTSTHDDTNRYTTIGGNSVSYDAAGNLTVDHNGYSYVYDYENRIVEIQDDDDTTVAEYYYDALSRRIAKVDNVASETTLYYYNDQWQVLQEYNDAGTTAQMYFVYGNYIDEVLMMNDGTDYYYAHDHLYSPAALMEAGGDVIERYEYNAYGKMTRFDPDFASWSGTEAGNPYYFTGRRLDNLDLNGELEIMYYRNRYYDTNTGRFLTQDPLGVNPAGGDGNPFEVAKQYMECVSLYEYVRSVPTLWKDPIGLEAYTYETCLEMYNARAAELVQDLISCGLAAGFSFIGDVPVCATGCTPFLAGGTAGYYACFTGCTGLNAVANAAVFGACSDVINSDRESAVLAYDFCNCRAGGGSRCDCWEDHDTSLPWWSLPWAIF